MSKVKKVLAIILSMAMILGMSLTTFAAVNDTATITIKNAGNDTFLYYQVIVADQTTETGWAFADSAVARCYTAANAFNTEDEQKIIQDLLDYKANPTANAATAPKLVAALENVGQSKEIIPESPEDGASANGKYTFTVNAAGVYFIEGISEKDEDNNALYVYSPMAAYVAFGNYDTTTGLPTELTDAEVEAKKTAQFIEKSVEDQDKVMEIGRVVQYTIETVVPYFSDDIADPEYSITDKITNAVYVKNENGDSIENNKVPVLVKVGTGSAEPMEATFTAGVNGERDSFKLNLNNIAKDRTNANKTLTITYYAKVTDTQVGNDVIAGSGDEEFATNTNNVYTATINLQKNSDDKEQPVGLANAKFVLKRDFTEGDETVTKYAVVKKEDNVYKLTGEWKTAYETTNSIEDTDNDGFVDDVVITTGTDGKATIKGIDNELTYTLEEIEAPEGYTIADDTTIVKTDKNWSDADVANTTIDVTVVDTKLNKLPLPSTGGIGTTIFTIGGCVIMIAAAGLYFASRRKESK